MTPMGALQALGASCTRAEILTFTALELHADRDTGFCCPGRETLAAITGLPENRITKATSSLEKKGFIRKEQPDPFHVHYFILPPPEIKPVEPRARFRPPLKARPVEPARPVPPAEPAPAPTSATSDTDPCHQRHEPVPPAAPLTDQWTDQKEKESASPEPPAPEPAPQPQAAHSVPLRNTKTGVPDTIPEIWLEQAAIQRPDLTADIIRKSAAIFLDNHRAKASMFADWQAAFRVWIARERAAKAPTSQPAAQPASRYPTPEQEQKPVSAAVQAAIDAGEQRRIAMLRKHGIDPVSGLKIQPPAPPAATLPDGQPLPQGRAESDRDYEVRFEQHRRYQLQKLQELMEARAKTKERQ